MKSSESRDETGSMLVLMYNMFFLHVHLIGWTEVVTSVMMTA